MICQIQYYFFFCPFDILQYKFLSYREVLHVLSESSELSQLRANRAPRGFQLHGEVPSPPSSETSRSSGTIQTSHSSISSHPAFPDACFQPPFPAPSPQPNWHDSRPL